MSKTTELRPTQQERIGRALEDIRDAIGLDYHLTVIARSNERGSDPILITGECTPAIQNFLLEVARG